jgi:ribosome-binding factor A
MTRERRGFKLAMRIQSILGMTLLRLSDPRFYLVTITGVILSKDLRHAKVYWVVTGGLSRKSEVEASFVRSRMHLRSSIASELEMRSVPELHFFYDDTLEVQAEVGELMKRLT